MNGLSLIKQLTLRLNIQLTEYLLLPLFFSALQDPTRTQQSTLATILARDRETEFGKQYGFSTIRSESEFRQRVPIQSYEDHRPYLETSIQRGSGYVDCKRPVIYVQTSGTTGSPKHIPVYRETLRSYQRAQNISSYFQYKSTPGIFSGKILDIVSPLIECRLKDGSSCGSMSGLLSQHLPLPLRAKRIIPRSVFEIPYYEERYRLIAALAISEPDITCLASANPSTFLRLIEIIHHDSERLIEFVATANLDVLGIRTDAHLKAELRHVCIANKSRSELLAALFKQKGDTRLCDLWTNLKAVVTWTSGNCGLLIPKLKNQLSGQAAIIEMGYIASEFLGTVIVNPTTASGCPTIQDNFFEFIELAAWDSGSKDTVLIGDLEAGKRYYVIVTTSSRLYRYFINDIVEVKGVYRNTPTITFVQKGKGVTSLTGEKLYEEQVIAAVEQVFEKFNVEINPFIMVADRVTLSYVLYLEREAALDCSEFAKILDIRLSEMNIKIKER